LEIPHALKYLFEITATQATRRSLTGFTQTGAARAHFVSIELREESNHVDAFGGNYIALAP